MSLNRPVLPWIALIAMLLLFPYLGSAQDDMSAAEAGSAVADDMVEIEVVDPEAAIVDDEMVVIEVGAPDDAVIEETEEVVEIDEAVAGNEVALEDAIEEVEMSDSIDEVDEAAAAKDTAAAEAREDFESYIYLGGSFSIGIENFDQSGYGSFDEALGFSMWLGYRLNRWVGLEGRLANISGFDSTLAGESVDFELLYFTGNLKVYPLTGMFQPYVVIGLGHGTLESSRSKSETGVVFLAGGGIEVLLLDQFSVMAEVDYNVTNVTNGDIKHFDFFDAKLGVQFRF
jgi:opacity protein-like surface antigen